MSLTLKGTAGMLSSHIKVHQRPVQMLNKVWIVVHGETARDSRYLLRDPSSTHHRQSLHKGSRPPCNEQTPLGLALENIAVVLIETKQRWRPELVPLCRLNLDCLWVPLVPRQ